MSIERGLAEEISHLVFNVTLKRLGHRAGDFDISRRIRDQITINVDRNINDQIWVNVFSAVRTEVESDLYPEKVDLELL